MFLTEVTVSGVVLSSIISIYKGRIEVELLHWIASDFIYIHTYIKLIETCQVKERKLF